jgi:hypothetical protein
VLITHATTNNEATTIMISPNFNPSPPPNLYTRVFWVHL